MTEERFLETCWSVWASAKMEGEKDEMRDRFKELVDLSIDKATIKSDGRFTFATDIKSYTFTSTGNKITVYGNNDDCRDVYTILWGSKEIVLRPYTEYERDISFSGATPTGAVGWTRRPTPDDEFPIIEFIGTVASGDTCKFRYIRKGLTLSDWPEPWHWVLMYQVLGMASSRFEGKAQQSLSEMIDFFKSPQRGSTQALPDPTTRYANVRASAKYIG